MPATEADDPAVATVPTIDPFGEVRFYLLASISVIVLAVISTIALSRAGIPDGQTTSIMVMIVGFATLIISQLRTAIQVASQAVLVRDTLEQTNRRAVTVNKRQVARTEEVAHNVEATTAKVEEVRQVLGASVKENAAAIGNLQKVTKATHTLVNSNMAAQLYINMVLARRLVEEMRTPTQADRDAADLAEKVYREHIASQDKVDLQPGTDEEKKGEH